MINPKFFMESDSFKVFFTIKEITNRNSTDGFTIAEVKAYKEGESIRKAIKTRVKGFFPLIYEGDTFSGNVVVELNPQRGYTLKLIELPLLIRPQIEKEVIEFISKRVKGVSKKQAEEIVNFMGLDCLRKIEEDTVFLMSVPNMTPKKAEKIQTMIREQKTFDELLIFLQQYDIAPSLANKIYTKMGTDCVTELKQNPYALLFITGVKFKQADSLANRLGWDQNTENRIKFAILNFLKYISTSNGDICSIFDTLYRDVNQYLKKYGGYEKIEDLNQDTFNKVVEYMKEKSLIIVEEGKPFEQAQQRGKIKQMTPQNLPDKIQYIYSKHFHWMEENIVGRLATMLKSNQGLEISEHEVEKAIRTIESESVVLDPKQRDAVYMALSNKLSILTGGPGTGKTQTTNAIVKVYEMLFPDKVIKLLAPTGRAAKRMTELSGRESTTIHKAIGLRGEDEFSQDIKIEADIVIIDESSLIDCITLDKFLDALLSHTKVVLVGDYDQLPSVGAGLILRDLINSECVPTVRLTTIFRQAQESQIVMNSHAIIEGRFYDLSYDKNKGDFYFLDSTDIPTIKALILKSVEKMHKKYNYSINDICVLSPLKKGDLGIESLNQDIQRLLNPESPNKKEMYVKDTTFREGDKVMNLVNDSEKGVVNGEIGYVKSVNSIEGEYFLEIDFTNEGCRMYTREECDNLTLCYAMSVHKSQGSEFPVVITPIHSSHDVMLNRNIIYTALTRAKQVGILIGEKGTLADALMFKADIVRLSQIKDKLRKSLTPTNPVLDSLLMSL